MITWPGDDDIPGVDAPPGSWDSKPGDRFPEDAAIDLYWPWRSGDKP